MFGSNLGTVRGFPPFVRARYFLFKSFPIYRTLITLPLDAIWSGYWRRRRISITSKKTVPFKRKAPKIWNSKQEPAGQVISFSFVKPMHVCSSELWHTLQTKARGDTEKSAQSITHTHTTVRIAGEGVGGMSRSSDFNTLIDSPHYDGDKQMTVAWRKRV